MKKMIFLFLLASAFSFGQYRSDYGRLSPDRTNEIKVNALSLLIYGTEIGYERIVSDGVGAGISVMVPYKNTASDKILTTSLNYYISPYVRYYFEPMASGFFFEGFGIYANRKHDTSDASYTPTTPNYSTFGLGFGGGRKWVQYSGFTFEASAGIGRNIIVPDHATLAQNFSFKLGVSAGYRF
jgi:hypothetical protein